MASDYSIMEEDLKNQMKQLKRDLHMIEVRKLARKQYGLAKMSTQKKTIDLLKKQIVDLEPTVSRIYSSSNAIKDHQIKGYLIYLLHLKDYFTREVKTKKEIIKNREDQIKRLLVKLCQMRKEYAKKIKSLPTKSSEFIRLNNTANRKNQLDRRLCTIQSENKKLRDNISDMQMFQKQYKKLEKRFREKIENMTSDIQTRLDNAVSIYEERDDFVYKAKLYEERLIQDIRKASVNDDMLTLVLEKAEKFEDFKILQNAERIDSRLAVTGDLIEQGITGLEPVVKSKRDLYQDIAHASGQDNLSDMKEHFDITDDETNASFVYLEELQNKIQHTENVVQNLKMENMNLLKSLTLPERKLRWEIGENRAKTGLFKIEAEQAEAQRNFAREDLDDLYANLWKTYGLFGFDETEFDKVDDSNAEALKERIEKEIIEYLMLMEYLKMKEVNEEDIGPIVVEEDLPVIEDEPEIEFLDKIQPRIYKSEEHISILSDVEEAKHVLPFEHFKQSAKEVVAEMEAVPEEEDEEGRLRQMFEK